MIDKNSQTDTNGPWKVVRTISAVEALTPTPGLLGTASLSAPIFRVRSKIIAVRIFADVDDANPLIGIYAESPQDGDKYPMGNNVFLGTVSCTGVLIAVLNPFTKEVCTETWHAAAAFSASAVGHCGNQVRTIPEAANAAHEMRFTIDCLGDTYWYPYATSMGSTAANKILVAMKEIE